MRRTILVIGLALFGVTVFGQGLGGGIAVWVPESLYLANDGGVGVESSLGTSMRLGDFLSLPVSVAYDQVYALMPEIDATVGAAPWFFADTLLASIGVEARVPLGPLYAEVFGGLAGFWTVALSPLTKAIEGSVDPDGSIVTFQDAIRVTGGRLGWGWQAGGSIGVAFGRISVDLSATYRLLRTDATIAGTYAEVNTSSSTVTTDLAYSQAVALRLAGLLLGIHASYSM